MVPGPTHQFEWVRRCRHSTLKSPDGLGPTFALQAAPAHGQDHATQGAPRGRAQTAGHLFQASVDAVEGDARRAREGADEKHRHDDARGVSPGI